MAEILKSALFVDYDSIHRSLSAGGRDGDALAQRTSAWVVAIESGRLVSVKGGGGPNRRRFALRRCYADPARLGKNRIAFVAAGFELIDCPASDGRKNAAGMNVALDVIEALAHPTAYEEFVLLSADTDLAPIIQRLHSLERAAVVYSGPATSPANIEVADGVVEEGKLASLLFADEAPAQRPAAPAAASPPSRASAPSAAAKPAAPAAGASRSTAPAVSERAEIEALARRVHSGTNIPLLSPRTFAELFRLLATEISERGYHFQETAERVSSHLTAAGRNVTRRQVVFVVKGLALKGHVFSTTDTAERLAEVFREQALYLVGNAGLELTDRERTLLPAWISAQVGPVPSAAATPAQVPASPSSPAVDEAKAAKRKGPRPGVEPKTEVAAPKPETPPKPVQAKAPLPKPAEPPRQAAPTPPRQPQAQPKAQPRPAAPQKPPPAPKPAAKPAAKPPKEAASSEALESSILAAIAQAVDVLIEDSHSETGENPAKTPPPPRDKEPPAAPVEPRPDQPPSEGGESDDIGDEIQRIIASYSRARQQGES
jgi:hypothetical protein